MTDEAKALVEECRLDAKAFRENTVYDSDGDPIRLIANADRLDQYADLIETQAREIERLRGALKNPPEHKFWLAGEADCPAELKAGNGELHTLRCKVCGEDNLRNPICLGGL